MIEGILRKRPGTFAYGTVEAVYEALQQVEVRLQSGILIRVQTSLIGSLRAGDTVIVAENDQDQSKFIVQYSRKALPSQGTLLLI
jgi:hypothetical protein